jgi:hypothetical protein
MTHHRAKPALVHPALVHPALARGIECSPGNTGWY